MADLSLAPAEQRSLLKPILIAVIALALIAFAVFWFNPRGVADVTVPHVDLFAPHTEFKSLTPKAGMHVLSKDKVTGPIGAGAEDNLYVVATVHIDNKLRLPIFVSSVEATITTADGEQHPAAVVHASELPRLEQMFPNIATLAPHPINDSDPAPPKGQLEGQVVLLFATLTADDWHKKKAADLTLVPAHQDPITVKLP
jgi:hypothetical protein